MNLPVYKNHINEDDIVVIVDLMKPMTRWFILVLVSMFILSQAISITLVFLILSTLRRNTDNFSHNAYKVHKQFTVLLGVQVRFC
jgi:hypothetical protein